MNYLMIRTSLLPYADLKTKPKLNYHVFLTCQYDSLSASKTLLLNAQIKMKYMPPMKYLLIA